MAVTSIWPERASLSDAWEGAKEDVQDDGVRPHYEYQKDPIGWIVDKLGVDRRSLLWSLNGYDGHAWDGTADPLACVLEALAEGRNVGVESATGTGKTFLGAAIVLWFLACWEDAIVVTAAPKQDQLKLHIWKEIGRLWPRFRHHFPKAQLLDGKVRMRDAVEDRETWAATAFVCGVGADEASATKAQGFHAEHMLIITEETPGIHPAIMTAFENTCTAPHNLRLAFGNPDHQEDELHRFCLSPGVVHVRVSALDHPNVVTGDDALVPGAVGSDAVERRRSLYAHLPALFESRVRGISPKQAVGVTLKYNEADHLEDLTDDEAKALIAQGKPFGGIDFGEWRFAFTLYVPDTDGVVHEIEEYFSQREGLEDRARALDDLLRERFACPTSMPIWGDYANQQDIREINNAFKRVAKEKAEASGEPVKPYRVSPNLPDGKLRSVSVARLNDLLGRKALRFRRTTGEGMTWRRGYSTASDGRPTPGSRLLWEIRNWRYPDPRAGEAQQQDPDDDTADGADMMASMRYAIMSWWSAAKPPEEPEKPTPNRDTKLERLLDRLNREQRVRSKGDRGF